MKLLRNSLPEPDFKYFSRLLASAIGANAETAFIGGFFHDIGKAIDQEVGGSHDVLSKEILEKYHLPVLKTALIWIHMPKKEGNGVSARKRFAFEEIFFIQLQKMKERKEYQRKKSFLIDKSSNEIDDFIKRFPFQATGAQEKAIEANTLPVLVRRLAQEIQ